MLRVAARLVRALAYMAGIQLDVKRLDRAARKHEAGDGTHLALDILHAIARGVNVAIDPAIPDVVAPVDDLLLDPVELTWGEGPEAI